jgi:ABC-type nitrate/sulfonate/bicarbonate transport system permease component
MAQATEELTTGQVLVDEGSAETLPQDSRWRRAIFPTAFLVGVVVLWEIASRATDVPAYILPAPTAIAERLVRSWGLL